MPKGSRPPFRPLSLAVCCLLVAPLALAAQDPRAEPGPRPRADRTRGPQVVDREELIRRRDAGLPIGETEWDIREDGTLLQWPNPAAGGSTALGMSFVGDERWMDLDQSDSLVVQLGSRRSDDALFWLAPLLRRPGNLLAATNAERHFAQLGRDASAAALRQYLALAGDAGSEALQRRDALDRELAIRLLQRRGDSNAQGELRVLAKDADDPFLREAARDALATFGAGTTRARTPLHELGLAPPARADLWLFVDTGRVPPRPDVADTVRAAHAKQIASTILAAGGAISDIILAKAQMLVDQPEELPFEAARLWGRARIDQCLLAFAVERVPDGAERLALRWAAASGAVETGVLARHLGRLAIGHDYVDGVVKSSHWWPGYEVTVARDRVVVRVMDAATEQATTPAAAAAAAARAPWPPFATAAASDGAALAAEVPADSRLDAVPWLLLEPGGTATVRLQPFALRVTRRGDAAAATTRCAAAATALGRFAAPPPDDEWNALWFSVWRDMLPAATLGNWQRALRAAAVTPIDGEDRVAIEIAGAGLDPLQLWPLLR